MFTVTVSGMVRSVVAVSCSGVGHGVLSGVVVVRRQTSVRTAERGPRSQQRQDHEDRNLHRNRRSHPATAANCLSCLAGGTPRIDGSVWIDEDGVYGGIGERAAWQEDVLEISSPTLIICTCA
uniref:Uncharacterized protein n=1 Tax=Schizaphis graminum TaxID=13262 RepID=A0A2S2NRZ0_SCHGA